MSQQSRKITKIEGREIEISNDSNKLKNSKSSLNEKK